MPKLTDTQYLSKAVEDFSDRYNIPRTEALETIQFQDHWRPTGASEREALEVAVFKADKQLRELHGIQAQFGDQNLHTPSEEQLPRTGYVQAHAEAVRQIEDTKFNLGVQKWDTSTAFRENLQIAREGYGLSGVDAMQRAVDHTKNEVIAHYEGGTVYRSESSRAQKISAPSQEMKSAHRRLKQEASAPAAEMGMSIKI